MDVRTLVPPRKAEWSLSGEPKATGNTFLLLSFYLLVFLSHRILICLFFLISYYSPAAIIRNAKIGNIILLHAFFRT